MLDSIMSVRFPSEVFDNGDIWDDKGNKCVMRRGHGEMVQAQLLQVHICERVQKNVLPTAERS